MNILSSELSDRTVTLCSGRPGLRNTISVDVCSPSDSSHSSDPSDSTLDFISSDETLDRYSEIISASGWKLDTYRRNPVFQNAHQYGDIIFTLGRAEITEVRSGKLYQRIRFATDVNPMAKIAYGLYGAKFLNAVSVGFLPLKWEDAPGPRSLSVPADPLSASGGEGRGEVASLIRSPQFRRRYLEQELLEVSAVAIPANPNALALAYKSGAVEKSDLKELADLLRHTLAADHRTTETPQHRSTLVPAPTLHAPRSTLALALQLRDLLKHL